jgi:hypothetical protein
VHLDCRASSQHARTAKHAADTNVAMAAATHTKAERNAHFEQEKLLVWCPQVQSHTVKPFLTSFSFKTHRIETTRRCQLAMSILMAPAQDVMLVPYMADVSRHALPVPASVHNVFSMLLTSSSPALSWQLLQDCKCAFTSLNTGALHWAQENRMLALQGTQSK